jgi:hypothetical protein
VDVEWSGHAEAEVRGEMDATLHAPDGRVEERGELV